jgi:hypothetical protein
MTLPTPAVAGSFSAAYLPDQVGIGGGLFEQRGQFAALLGGETGAEAPADRLAVYRPGAQLPP